MCLSCNKNIPIEFIKKHIDSFNKPIVSALCSNTNVKMDFFEENLDKVNWGRLSKNDFSSCLNNIQIQENKFKIELVFEEIENFVYCGPCNIFSCLARGGEGYREVLEKYDCLF